MDVDAGGTEQGADLAERPRLVEVVDDQVHALGAQIEVAAVDLDDLLTCCGPDNVPATLVTEPSELTARTSTTLR